MASTLPKHPSEKTQKQRPRVTPLKLPLHHNKKCPPIPRVYPWTKIGRDYWKCIWASPMALVYIDADHSGLLRMTILTEIFSAGEANAALLSELRQLEDRFGMNPWGRRKLQFDIDLASNRLKPESEREPENDSRWLRVVDSA